MTQVFEKNGIKIMQRNHPKNGKMQYAKFERIWNGCWVLRGTWKYAKQAV